MNINLQARNGLRPILGYGKTIIYIYTTNYQILLIFNYWYEKLKK